MSQIVVGKLVLSSGLQVPNVTSGTRPTGAVSGSIIFNTSTSKFEKWNGSSWETASTSSLDATGGTIAYWGPYKIHIFTTVGTSQFVVSSGSGEVDYLIVAGGGGGGMDMGGAGGGGGVLQGKTTITSQSYNIVVGQKGYGAPGGSGGYRTDGVGPQPSYHQFTIPATNGGNSSAFGLNAIGGGCGGSSYYGYSPESAGSNGGSGGGASGYSDGGTRSGGTGTVGQGYNGGRGGGQYYSGGGGGAGGKGFDSTYQPNGGPGVACDILGSRLYWGGGGGGGAYSAYNGGNGGIGGGGGGSVGFSVGGDGLNPGSPGGGGGTGTWTNTPGGNAGANTGGGGGGGGHYNANNKGGEGGTGIVVIRYRMFE